MTPLERLRTLAAEASVEAVEMRGLPNEISEQEGYAAGLQAALDLAEEGGVVEATLLPPDKIVEASLYEIHKLNEIAGCLGKVAETCDPKIINASYIRSLASGAKALADSERVAYSQWFDMSCDKNQAVRDAIAEERARCMQIVRDHWGGYESAAVYDSLMEAMRDG